MCKKATIQGDTMPRYNAVNGSDNQNLSNSFMESGLNIMMNGGESMLSSRIPTIPRQGPIHVMQQNTKTGEQPGYMPSALAFSTDVYHRNNRKDGNQATMKKMGMECGRMRKEPDNQSSSKATAKIDRNLNAAAVAAYTHLLGNEDPYDSDSDSAYLFFLFGQDPDSTQSVFAVDTTDEESDTDESKDMSDQDKALFEERLNTLIEAAMRPTLARRCC